MNPETLNAMNEEIYRAVFTLLEAIALTLGLASVLFIIFCLVCATCGYVAEARRTARRLLQPHTPTNRLRQQPLTE